MDRKILLTSAGFESKLISDKFIEFVRKKPTDIKALFIPTAANNPDAIEVLPKCMNDLLNIGIPKENITVFDLHCCMTIEELSEFDTVYFTGGSTQYLLDRINSTGFNKSLQGFIGAGGVYLGVSAGSIVAAGNLPDNLGYLNAKLHVHAETGTIQGVFDNESVKEIKLTNNNAIAIHNETYEII